MSATNRAQKRRNQRALAEAIRRIPAIERVNEYLALDQLKLVPVWDKYESLREESQRGQERFIVHYELRESTSSGRRNIGLISKTFLSQLNRMHPRKIATSLNIVPQSVSYARRALKRAAL